ncbi:MAG: hypothetical protein IK026_06835 [Eubacteriaceae bacterium]|nr:hypothetical protein [Eubacteriaceae bacterium]
MTHKYIKNLDLTSDPSENADASRQHPAEETPDNVPVSIKAKKARRRHTDPKQSALMHNKAENKKGCTAKPTDRKRMTFFNKDGSVTRVVLFNSTEEQ